MPEYDSWDPARAADVIAEGAKQPGATLPILHALQRAFGHVPRDAVPMVAAALNLSRAEVYGVLSFYHDFREAPAGRHVLKLCRAEACQAMGADALHRHAQEKLRVGWGDTTIDGRVTLEPVFCLGLCFRGPAAIADGKVHAGLDQGKLDTLIERMRAA